MKKTLIGGQAVIEGVMMRGKESMAIAVRDSDNIVRLETKRIKSLKEKSIFFRIPIIRGMLAFFLTMVDGVKTLMKSAEVFGEAEPGKFEKWLSKKFKIDLMSIIMAISLILGFSLAIGLFIFLPNLILRWSGLEGKEFAELINGGFKVAILFFYLIAVSLLKDIRRTFQYHGAEHKTINCFEKELPLNVENVRKCSKLHNRCGTTFLFFVILVSIAVAFGVNLIIPELKSNTFLRILARIATLPLVAGLAYELLKFLAWSQPSANKSTNFKERLLKFFTWIIYILLYPLRVPGLILQLITTKQPDDKMIEVAIVSFNAVLEMDNNSSVEEVKFPLQKKYPEVRAEMEEKLLNCGITEKSDLDWILCSVLKRRRSELGKTNIVSVRDYELIAKLVYDRCTNKPVEYVLSETNFYGYTIKLNNNVLIPRFETELLCEQVINAAGENSKILDLCCGSGAIAIAVCKETKAKVTASDISEKALELSKENAALNLAEIEFIKSDMFENVTGKFDIIVSNPPYIKTADIKTLPKEVKDFEPHLALDGGEDGYKFYRTIAKAALSFLNKKGILLLECGLGQAKDIKAMLEKNFNITIIKDYSKIDRIIKATLKN